MKKKKILAGLAMINLALWITGSAYAAMMTVEMTGRISGKPAAFLDSTSVHVGDIFGITFNYDDSLQTTQLVSVNGGVLNTVVQPFSPSLTGWWGTLPEEIILNNSSFTNDAVPGWGTAQSWYGPLTASSYADWRITSGIFTTNPGQRGFDFQIVTNWGGSPGYGWWAIGSEAGTGVTNNAIDYGTLDITSLSIIPATPSSVPIPPSIFLLLSGITLLGLYLHRHA